jgi:hypothetical protein
MSAPQFEEGQALRVAEGGRTWRLDRGSRAGFVPPHPLLYRVSRDTAINSLAFRSPLHRLAASLHPLSPIGLSGTPRSALCRNLSLSPSDVHSLRLRLSAETAASLTGTFYQLVAQWCLVSLQSLSCSRRWPGLSSGASTNGAFTCASKPARSGSAPKPKTAFPRLSSTALGTSLRVHLLWLL